MPSYQAPSDDEYKRIRDAWLHDMEGFSAQVYACTADCKTIGKGFNMDAQGAREEWNKAFGGLGKSAPDFDRVCSGEQCLTTAQVELLYETSVKSREQRLARDYGDAWEKLSAKQRVAILSAFFTNETSIVTGDSRFKQHMLAYAVATTEESKQSALKNAARELGLQTKSNPSRRYAEALLLLGQDTSELIRKKTLKASDGTYVLKTTLENLLSESTLKRAEPSTNPPQTSLKKGDRGENVSHLQRMLNDLGESLEVDAKFGKDTEAAVIRFQQKNNLSADGVVGRETWSALDDEIEKKNKKTVAGLGIELPRLHGVTLAPEGTGLSLPHAGKLLGRGGHTPS